MKRQQRRTQAAKQRKLLKAIHVQSFRAHDPDTGKIGFYWFEDRLPDDVEMHGPFETDAECEQNQVLVLMGPDCNVTEGGVWNPAWERLQ